MKIRNPNLQMILETHIKEWFIKEKLERGKKKRPLILISRQRGAGGLSVAEHLSERLGWPYYDKNIIKEVADTFGADKRHLEFLDERDRNTFQEFANVFRQDPEVSQDDYVEYLKRFIKKLGQVGGSIIVGRGANFVLSPQDALRVRLVAEPEARARLAAQRYGIKEDEATNALEKWDREQKNFIRRYFDQDIADPQHYDLVINTTHIGLEGAVELIIAAYKRKFPEVFN